MAVRLLPEVATRRLERSDQQYALGGFAGLAADAAALVLADPDASTSGTNRAQRALGLLEAGRAVLLSQALDTRSDLTDLRRLQPLLAAQFVQLRDKLDQPPDDAAARNSQTDGASTPARSASQPVTNRRQLADRLAAVLEQIRALDGFASFGRPPALSDLLADATDGPVIAFSISAYRSDALLLTANGVASLPLPGLAMDTLTGQIESFYDSLHAAADPGATPKERRQAQAELSRILEWLWDIAAEPILHALGYDSQPSANSAWPRVWWVPGGLLSLLPIHAAGYHIPAPGNQDRRTVMDRVISSYTPTVRALRYARQHLRAAADRSLIVAMPITPRLPGWELPNVPGEVDKVRALLPDPLVLTEPGMGEESLSGPFDIPTRANVLARLPGCSIAHFSCHGASDPRDPSRSQLMLHDHDRSPFTVASLNPVNLTHAQLAYLSACRTAFNPSLALLDEAIHLTTAFQLAGFPHVIGTLWEINDNLAIDVAESFYTALHGSDGTLDISQATHALHRAIRYQRDQYPRTPSLWAAYLHAGK